MSEIKHILFMFQSWKTGPNKETTRGWLVFIIGGETHTWALLFLKCFLKGIAGSSF